MLFGGVGRQMFFSTLPPPSCYYILEGALAIVYTYRFQNARTRPHALASGSARPTHFSSAARDAPQTLLPKRSHSSTNCSSSASSATPAWAVRPNGREVRACARSSLKPPHGTRNTYLCFSLSLSLSLSSLSLVALCPHGQHESLPHCIILSVKTIPLGSASLTSGSVRRDLGL